MGLNRSSPNLERRLKLAVYHYRQFQHPCRIAGLVIVTGQHIDHVVHHIGGERIHNG